MKKIFLLIAAVGVFIACDPVHEKIDNGIDNSNHITKEQLKSMTTVIVDKVAQVAGQENYTATGEEPVSLIENIDVKDCEAVTIYFNPETIADTCWRISFSGENFEKIKRGSAGFRHNLGNEVVNGILPKIVIKHIKDKDSAPTNTITVDGIYKAYGPKVANEKEGELGNVVTCQTSAPVNAKWDIGGKEFLGNFASKKMKVEWDENYNYLTTAYLVKLTALCPDGTLLTAEYPIKCEKVSNPLEKVYIYGEDPGKEPPFVPENWNSNNMRFSDGEGAHFPFLSDDVYWGFKTLIIDVANPSDDLTVKVMSGWWDNVNVDDQHWKNGLNEFPLTEDIAKVCAKGNGGNAHDLTFMVTSGTCTVNAVYYEE